MVMQILTNEIGTDEWKFKLVHSDEEWLLRQYYGLSKILDIMEKEVVDKFHALKLERGTVHDEVYREIIYPMENRLMEVDTQFVDVEDELYDRGIDPMMDEMC
jgi:hypothetical protein